MAGELVTVRIELFHSGSWHDITADVRDTDLIQITRGIANEGGRADPGSMTLKINNGTSNVEPSVVGRYSPRNPRSDLFGLIGRNTPIRVSAGLDPEALSVRAVMEAVAWPVRWDLSEADVWVPLECAGILRRLGTPSRPLSPALTRAIRREPAVVACWSLAGLGQDVTRAPSVVGGETVTFRRPTGGPGGLSFGVELSADTRAPGLGALPTVRNAETGFAFTGQLPAGIGEPFAWSMWGRAEGDDIGSDFTMWIDTSSTQWLLWVIWDAHTNELITVVVQARDEDGNSIALLSNTNDIPFDDSWHNFAVIVEQDGADVDLTVLMDGQEVPMTLDSGSLSGLDVGTPQQTRPTGNIPSTNPGRGMSIGYPTVLTGPVATLTTAIQELHTAGRGHAGEPAGRRVERLCSEEGVAFASRGDLDATTLMGPQRVGNFLTLLDECAAVEAAGGLLPVLVEQRSTDGLRFDTRDSFYLSSGVMETLTLDYSTAELWAPFEPIEDDQQTVNDVTAQRVDGGESRAVDQDGTLGVNMIGLYDRTLSLVVAADLQLPDIAGWALHLGTWDEARYPVITVNLRGLSTRTDGGDLVDDALALGLGDLLVVENLPEWMPGDVEQLTLGYSESIRQAEWAIGWHGAPAGPYVVGVFADDEEEPGPDEPKRYSPSDARVAAPFLAGTDTALTVQDRTGGADPWSQSADFPYDVRARGVRLRVTAVGAPQPPFVISSIPAAAGANSRGLTWDGTALWLADQVATSIHRVDPADGTVLDTLSVAPDEPFGLAWDGAALWYVDNDGNIRRIDPSTGTILESFPTPGGFPRGLTWDGQFLWHSDSGTNLIYRLDPSSGNVLQSFAGPTTTPAGLAWDGAALWVAGRAPNPTVLYRVNPSNGALMSSFLAPGAGPWGLAWDGITLWNADTDSELIFRISPLPTQQLTVDQTPVNGVTGVTINPGQRVELWQPARYAL